MVRYFMLLILIIGCKNKNHEVRQEIYNFLLDNNGSSCATIVKDDSDETYEISRLTVVCGERREPRS